MYKKLFLTTAVALSLSVQASQAAFVLVDDFESRTLGDIGGQGNWTNLGGAAGDLNVVVDPAGGGNQVIDMAGGDADGRFDLSGSQVIGNGTTGTLFLQARGDVISGTNNFFGLADQNGPGFAAFEVQLDLQQVRSGGGFLALDQSFADDTWYNFWLVADASANTFQAFVQGGAFTTQTQVTAAGGTSTFNFRNGGTTDLDRLYLQSGSGTTSSVFVDNIYIDNTGSNLVNPVPEPSTYALIGIGLGALALLRRRKK